MKRGANVEDDREWSFLLIAVVIAMSAPRSPVLVPAISLGVYPENETQKQGKQSLGRKDVHSKTTCSQQGAQALGGTAPNGRRERQQDRSGATNRSGSSRE